jgi:integrase/recombinase XerD
MKSVRNAIEDYIALRRSLGFKLHGMAASLGKFASFLDQKAAPYITTALTLEWAMQPVDHPPSHWAQRLGFVRVFARHWSATDPRTEIPPAGLLPFRARRARLIFTPNRRFKGCWLLPKASHPPAGFDHGLITACSVCWQSVGSGSARQ